MNRHFKLILAVGMAAFLVGCGSGTGSSSKIDPQRYANRNVAFDQYFTEIKADAAPAKPDEKGFIRRWTIIEPINKPNSGNTVFTDSYIQAELTKQYFPGQFTADIKALPKTGDKVVVESEAPRASGRGGFGGGFGGGAPQGAGAPGADQARPQGAPGAGAPQGAPQGGFGGFGGGAPQGAGAPGAGQARPQGAPQGAPQGGFGGFGGGMMGGGAPAAAAAPATVKDTLTWHSVDSKLFNIKLIRFATGLTEGKKRYGLIFNAFTVINCEQDIPNVRLAAGSNASSIWWVNGEQVLVLQADRRMVADDGMSKRITLKKGKNLVRAAVINGPGMSDMCARFYNEDGTILTNYTITNM